MAEGGFDDFEMKDKDRYRDEDYKEDEDEDETSFVDARENLLSPKGGGISSHEMSHRKIERVDITDIRKDARGMKKSMTEDIKRSYKKIFKLDIAKNNGFSSKYLIENTIFSGDGKTITIIYRGEEVGTFRDG